MKRFIFSIKLAWIGVTTNKIRSVLTIIGIVIGIAAVITLLALGNGAQDDINSSISSLGSNMVQILPGNSLRAASGINSDKELNSRDYQYLNNSVRFPNLSAVSPVVQGTATAQAEGNQITVTTRGVSYNYNEIQTNIGIQAGRFLTEPDIESVRNVAVIGTDVAQKLFPLSQTSEVLGKQFRIKDISFQVVGVQTEQGSSGFQNQNAFVYLPYSTSMDKLFPTTKYSAISLAVKDLSLVNATVLQIEDKLSQYRHLTSENRDFSVFTSADLLKTVGQITGIFTALLTSIAAISLLVGGIGISNIMLVSVTERTKEIGLRKAIGAKKSDILSQFLIEAVILTVFGGIIGIILGASMAYAIGSVANISVKLTADTVLLATSVSAFVGIVFGYIPAYKAAQLDPINALRYE